jgi:preprotein translocase subunit SecF
MFGGEVNRGFAFALTIGITTGTYSSIYIASAMALEWSLRGKAQAKLID